MKCELNDIQDYLEMPLKKITWKKKVNDTINKFWEKEFKTIIPFYKNLQYLNIENLKLGQLHPLLKVNVYSSRDVIRLPAKLKLMCGSLVLQTNRQKFNNSQVDPTCLLCQRDHETLEHYILGCSALDSIRLVYLYYNISAPHMKT